jgi:hypothetical protein
MNLVTGPSLSISSIVLTLSFAWVALIKNCFQRVCDYELSKEIQKNGFCLMLVISLDREGGLE